MARSGAAPDPSVDGDRQFGSRGRRLFNAFVERVDHAGLVLLEEACRIVDRLDKLNALLVGDADVWCRIEWDPGKREYQLQIDSALAEARQQVAELRQLLRSLPLKESDDDNADSDAWVADMQAAFRDS